MRAATTERMKDLTSRGALAGRPARVVLAAAGGMLLLAVVARLSGTTQLTAAGTWSAAVRLAVPVLLAGLGGIFSERAGIVNIGLEGMMIAGTWFGAWAGWLYGPWWGVAFGVAGGALFGLIHAVATVTFAVDHIVSGVAINILAAGAMRFLSVITYTAESGGGATQSPRIQATIGTFNVPVVASLATWVEARKVFFVSDLAGFVSGITSNVSWLTLASLAVVPAVWWLLWRTPWGLRLRSCGENPHAAESLGVPVLRMKYYGVLVSGALAGLGGAYLVVVQAGIYRESMTAGRGFLGLAAMIFGNWNPLGTLAGATLFGYADALRLRPGEAVHALLLFVAVVLVLLGVWAFLRGGVAVALGEVLAGVLFLVWYGVTTTVPSQVIAATPYLVTLIVLAMATQRLRMPAADGMRYRKGETG